jgi:hypothetical protein
MIFGRTVKFRATERTVPGRLGLGAHRDGAD